MRRTAPTPEPSTVQLRSISPPHLRTPPKSPSTSHTRPAGAATVSLTFTSDMVDLLVRVVSTLGRAPPRAARRSRDHEPKWTQPPPERVESEPKRLERHHAEEGGVAAAAE